MDTNSHKSTSKSLEFADFVRLPSQLVMLSIYIKVYQQILLDITLLQYYLSSLLILPPAIYNYRI